MKQLFLTVSMTVGLGLAPNALWAQSSDAEHRPATTSVTGATGIWFVPTGAVLPARQWSVSFNRTNADDGQGFSDISHFPVTFAVGLGNRAEVFGSLATVTRIDRDTRPLFFSSVPGGTQAGTGGGILVDHPLAQAAWTGNQLGDLLVGGKLNLLSWTDSGAAVGLRAMAKLPTGNTDSGASSGKADFEVDAIVSGATSAAEIAAYAGVITRGNPAGYRLTNGLRWGLGAAFPQRYSLGFRINTEIFGERYFDNTISAPASLTADDGSSVPTITGLKSPTVASVGVTWQARNGFFVGAAGSWNVSMRGRGDASIECSPGLACAAVVAPFTDEPKDDKGLQIRIGFHPGARRRAPVARATAALVGPTGAPTGPGGPTQGIATATGPAGPVAAAPSSGGPAAPVQAPNRPPIVRATCDPCTVEVGRTSTISADAQDPDGDPLTYQWAPSAGSVSGPTNRQTAWMAPQQVGAVPINVTVSDGRGGTARDTTTIQVVAARALNFDDVHFEFDQFDLRADAIMILDEAVTALQVNQNLRLTIEGHTCDIATAEYNLALGERRAQAVFNYLTGRGVAASRLATVSFGEERPKYDNDREETRRQNRRAALVVR